MRPILESLLEQQRLSGFPDLAGTDVVATIPVTDRLLNELIARLLPQGGTVRQVVLHARGGNEITAEVSLAKGAVALPVVRLMLEIHSQPDLPQRPVLGLRLKKAPLLLMLGGPILRMFDVVPPGISINGDRIDISLEALLSRHDMAGLLRYLTDVRVTTSGGAVVLSVRARIKPDFE